MTALQIDNVEQTNISDWLTVSVNIHSRNVAFKNPFEGGSSVSLTLKWSIDKDKNTTYPQSMELEANTDSGVSVEPISITPEQCLFSSSNQSCEFEISFNVPEQNSETQIKINAKTTESGQDGLLNNDTTINFTVTNHVQPSEAITTSVTVDTQCFAYKAGDVNLMANLSETRIPNEPDSSTSISNANLNYAIGLINESATEIGTAGTGDDGNASLLYNIDNLTAGDHYLFVSYEGDSIYKSSANSGILGIYYNFVGFQPPINPAGNSIFGNGRVVPVKVKIVDADLNPVTEAKPTVWIYKWSEGTGLGEDYEPATSVSSADTDNIMRYDFDEQQYIYNADLSALTNGTYAIVVDPNDSHVCNSGPYQAIITIAKKGKKG
ncbi:MAG: hypothetical protein ACK5MF_12015 [Vibrio sp.]|uniref:hypothetical protein n=1 Tax=Vibrio sp. TaxID=678 RepID=UPI003A86F99D